MKTSLARLKSLPPIAFGTPLSESLESYLERLCAVHNIQRKQLECFVTGELEWHTHGRDRAEARALAIVPWQSGRFVQ